jgi:hypothetical protein
MDARILGWVWMDKENRPSTKLTSLEQVIKWNRIGVKVATFNFERYEIIQVCTKKGY